MPRWAARVDVWVQKYQIGVRDFQTMYFRTKIRARAAWILHTIDPRHTAEIRAIRRKLRAMYFPTATFSETSPYLGELSRIRFVLRLSVLGVLGRIGRAGIVPYSDEVVQLFGPGV